MEEGKSDPSSIIQDIVFDKGGGEKRRAPRAEYEPAPPRTSKTGGFGRLWWISSGVLLIM